jgi:hypothetical protein
MPILGLVVLAIDIFTIMHALRSGRPYWWIFVIFSFPLIGSALYYAIEVAPGSRSERAIMRIGSDIARAVNPDKELQRRANDLEICGSVSNRISLAQECTERGMFDEAIRLYTSGREGQYANAPDLLLGLARAQFFNQDFPAARATLTELRAHHPEYYRQDAAILSARVDDACGDRTVALAELEGVLERSVGLEARYRYAEILWRDGQAARAKAELERVLDHAKRFRVGPAEKEWAKLSRRTLTALS